MSQVIGNPGNGTGGIQLGIGADRVGQVVILFGSGDPNGSTDASVGSAAVGSLYLRVDGGAGATLYVKESASAWTAK